MKTALKILIAFLLTTSLQAQINLNEYTLYVNDLKSNKFSSFFSNKIKNTQFIMLGEQHGIKEVGQITNRLFNIAKLEGYNFLCIETSPFAAKILELQFSDIKKSEEKLNKLYKSYPFSIPFYNNRNDIILLNNIIENKGKIWGIDQSFMTEFRLVFDYFINFNTNKNLKKAIIPLLEDANKGFEKAIKEKDMKAPFIFKYNNDLHIKLLGLTKSEEEKRILNDLQLSRKIYMYNFQQQQYLNNIERSKLMKRNFLNYYNMASTLNPLPKVLFKLGANHVGKGFNDTNVLDISNLITELASINNKESIHIYAMGINGTKDLGNPFAKVSNIPFNNLKKIPKEVIEINNDNESKYIIIDSKPLRMHLKKLSKKMKKLILKYDVLIFIKNCEALQKI